MPKIPQFGDPELLPKPTVVMPSRERNPFTEGGVLKPEGPGPYPPGFLEAADLLPFGDPHNPHSRYVRRRGDEWSNEDIRRQVLAFIALFVRTRPWIQAWQVVERWAPISSAQLGPRHLIIRLTRRAVPAPCSRSTRPIAHPGIETSAMVPKGADTSPIELAVILGSMGVALDAENARLK